MSGCFKERHPGEQILKDRSSLRKRERRFFLIPTDSPSIRPLTSFGNCLIASCQVSLLPPSQCPIQRCSVSFLKWKCDSVISWLKALPYLNWRQLLIFKIKFLLLFITFKENLIQSGFNLPPYLISCHLLVSALKFPECT